MSSAPVRSADLAELEHPQVAVPPPDEASTRLRWISLSVGLAVWAVLAWLLQGRNTQDLANSDTTGVQQAFNDLKDAVVDAKFQGNPLLQPFVWVSDAINWVVTSLIHLFVSDPAHAGFAQVGWAGVVALAVLVAYALSGVRIAVLTFVVLLVCGYLGYWDKSVETLIITGVAVGLCALVGMPVGIWMARSRRATTWFTPLLDAMQTMPSFAYLAPLALLFGIGAPGAVVVTMIYALPPLVRLTAHGLRTVSPGTVEATTSLGATSQQLLRGVQLPMARRTIVVGLNQTIMAALSMATIAAFIAAPGLGEPIVRGLSANQVGLAFVAGMCVVVLAILLDRGVERAGERSEAAARAKVDQGRRRIVLGVLGAVAVVFVYLSHTQVAWSQFPDSDLGRQLARRIDDWTKAFTDTFDTVSTWFSDRVTTLLLNPLEHAMANAPWWLSALAILGVAAALGGVGQRVTSRLVVGVAAAVAAVLAAGWWAGNTPEGVPWVAFWAGVVALLAAATWLGVGAALGPTAMCLSVIFAVGLWNDSMVTLSMTLVATLLVMLLGVAFGVWMGRSRRADTVIRPILDFLQTMPSLVYLIPAVALFPPGKFLAMAAAILYAAPVAIKIAADGIRSVAPPTVEAATSIGSSRWQMIGKVQLPMAKGSMVLAANQGLLFVLSMVVIGALVGGGSLGYLVISGFAQGELYGKGLAAGIAITALGIMLDRITVHTAARYGRAENE